MHKGKKQIIYAALVLLLAVLPAARALAADAAQDYFEIMQLSSKYAWGIDTVDRALLATVFAPDAVAEYVAVGENPMDLNERLVGFDNIFAWIHKQLGHREGTKGLPWHFVTNQVVELHGDKAELRYYMHNRPMVAGGVYHVQAVRTPQGWRIARLRLEEQLWKTGFYEKEKKS